MCLRSVLCRRRIFYCVLIIEGFILHAYGAEVPYSSCVLRCAFNFLTAALPLVSATISWRHQPKDNIGFSIPGTFRIFWRRESEARLNSTEPIWYSSSWQNLCSGQAQITILNRFLHYQITCKYEVYGVSFAESEHGSCPVSVSDPEERSLLTNSCRSGTECFSKFEHNLGW